MAETAPESGSEGLVPPKDGNPPQGSPAERVPVSDYVRLTRWADGDPAAGEALWALHDAAVKRTVSRFLWRPSEVADRDDVVQDAWLKVLKNREKAKCDEAGSMAAWVYVLAVRVCYDYFRRRHRLAEREVLDSDLTGDDDTRSFIETASDSGAPPAFILAGVFDLSGVVQCARRLPPRVQAVVVLHLVEEMGFEEIAQLVGCSVTGAWKVYRQGLRCIQWCMKQKGYPLGPVPVRISPPNDSFNADLIDVGADRHSYDLVIWGLEAGLRNKAVEVTIRSAPGSPAIPLTLRYKVSPNVVYGDKRLAGQTGLTDSGGKLIVSIELQTEDRT